MAYPDNPEVVSSYSFQIYVGLTLGLFQGTLIRGGTFGTLTLCQIYFLQKSWVKVNYLEFLAWFECLSLGMLLSKIEMVQTSDWQKNI
jgi:hypothetical protein